ncbi:MAG: GHKL domain-containing protein [Planctomycetes bacterium]|nr:GHKL domain-containing protein [Planctomycetota bacterium]
MSPSTHKQEEKQREREKRERLAYIGTLAAGLVHEMRTPLNAIQLNAQLLEEDFDKLPEKWRKRFVKRMGRICSEIRGIAKTLDGFLAFARPPRMDPVPTDLNHFLREVIEFSEPEFFEIGVELESNLASDMYPVVLDKLQFTHVMLNLFRNAREACEARMEKADDWADGKDKAVVRVTTSEKEDTIEILVDDNGIGIEPGKEEDIFELFYTTKEKGSGLGLGIVRRIVDEHGGIISAEDLPESGARFRIILPRGKFLEFREE